MTDTTEALKNAVRVIQKQRAQLAAVTAQKQVAVIGMGCRFPEAATPAALWDLFVDGRCVAGPLPSDRRLNVDGLTTTRAGYLPDIDRFDAAFFGISPREAHWMDPQQRLLLEVAWQALQDACIPPSSLAKTRTGVFVGSMAVDYGDLTAHRPADIHTGTGTSSSLLAGRLSYELDVSGPSVSVNTSCSSSLVAVQNAVDALRSGACDLAIAGGVNVVLTENVWRIESAAGMLSPDGRCKAYDESADGFGRGEGCGIVVLRRMQDAQECGDAIRAVIHGVAVNHDGRGAGVMVPNPNAQEAVIGAALADAGIGPDRVGYVETHGTGTPLGDPIEAGAVSRALLASAAHPVVIGGAKANLGHTEGAAGIAGLMRLILGLQAGHMPRHALATTPSSRIDWQASGLCLAELGMAFSADRPFGGVSSFGFSGTNAHVIVGPPPQTPSIEELPVDVLTLSAPDEARLRTLAGDFAVFLQERKDLPPALIAAALATGRDQQSEQCNIHLARGDTVAALHAVAGGKTHPALGTHAAATLPDTRVALHDLPLMPWADTRFWIEQDAAPPPVPQNRSEQGGLFATRTVPVTLGADAPLPKMGVVDTGGDLVARIASDLAANGTQVQVMPVARLCDLTEGTRVVFCPEGPAEAALVQAESVVGALQNVGGDCALTMVAQKTDTHTSHVVAAFLRSHFIADPSLDGHLIELADGAGIRDLPKALGHAQRHLVHGQDGWSAPRLAAVEGSAGAAFVADPNGLYLVTGGMGSLGLALATWLADAGAVNIAMVSRSGMPDDMASVMEERSRAAAFARLLDLRGRGVNLSVEAADVADAVAMERLVTNSGLRLAGVIHAAGVSGRDMPLADVCRPKVAGTQVLATLVRRFKPGLTLFCSSAGVWGGAGLGAYAAANGFMDATAVTLRAEGHRVLSMQFGGWQGSAMLSEDALTRFQASQGFGTLSPGRMIELLEQALRFDDPVLAALDFDAAKYHAVLKPAGFDGFLSGLVSEDAAASDFVTRLEEMHPKRRQAEILREATALAADLLGQYDSSAIGPEEDFAALGFNSLIALEFRDALAARLDQSLPSTLIYENPTLRHIADHLHGLLFPEETAGGDDDTDRELAEQHARLLAQLERG